MYQINIMIIEDDERWAKALIEYLNNEPDIRVTNFAKDKKTSMEIIKNDNFKADIILMDINLTEDNHDGIYIAAEISNIINAKIIMITSLLNEKLIVNSFCAGAVNYIKKNDYKKLPAAIRSVYNNESTFEILLKDYHRLKKIEQLSDLTKSERAIFGLMEQGFSKRQMEKTLFKSTSTLKTQITSILKKLGVMSRHEAIQKVNQNGIIEKKD